MDQFLQQEVIRDARSMEYFADGDKSIRLGAWVDWKRECMLQNRTIPPKEFKEHYNKQRTGA